MIAPIGGVPVVGAVGGMGSIGDGGGAPLGAPAVQPINQSSIVQLGQMQLVPLLFGNGGATGVAAYGVVQWMGETNELSNFIISAMMADSAQRSQADMLMQLIILMLLLDALQ